MNLDCFREIWLADFEFTAPPGERPTPICMVAREHRTGDTIRMWGDALANAGAPPFAVGPDSLFVAYYSSAEFGCFLSLGWEMPARVLDLFTEFRCATSGLAVPCGNGLLGALAYFGLPAIDAADKTEMRDLAIRGGPFTAGEMLRLVEYCETDVAALDRLLPAMQGQLDLPRALLRGRYMTAAAHMEWTGVPIDREILEALRENWGRIKHGLIAEVDKAYGVYVPTDSPLDPSTAWGQTILNTAAEYNADAHRLASAAQYLWREEVEARREYVHAVRDARKATGLTINRINKWEDAGGDYSTFPGFDETAQRVAGLQPALGIGPGFEHGANYDGRDQPAELWQLLRESAHTPRRDDPELLRHAAELVTSSGETPVELSFSAERFAAYLTRSNIPWPRLVSGQLDLSDDAFRQMARQYPAVAPLRELRHSLSQLRLNELAVGSDDRNRCLLSAFAARTGRNQPSNSKFIFGPSVWFRGLIQPPPGMAVAYVDWSQQEFGIAAALSGDGAMKHAYASADPYLTFAKQAGAVPQNATKETHKAQREKFKVCALAVQYGMGELSLAASLGIPEVAARRLLELHRQTYPQFWRWSQSAVDHAMLTGRLHTVFGWHVHVGGEVNPRSLANFPMQANGAEMLRLACCLATERGVTVCAPVHDAVLVEGPDDAIEGVVLATQEAMREASAVVLDGFELRTDAKIVRHPERYADPRGDRMWELVSGLLGAPKSSVPF